LRRHAAEQGYPKAPANLGFLYERGEGVPLDCITAYMWYGVGATSDHVASSRMKDPSCVMTARQIVEAKSRADLWMSAHETLRANRGEMGLALR
jgi:TPR repeat protein